MRHRKRTNFKRCLHDKVSVEFAAELGGHPLFQEHDELIMAAQFFLNHVANRNVENAKLGKPTGVPAREIRDLVKTYAKDVSYTRFRQVLIELELLEFDAHYTLPTTDASGKVLKPGKAQSYWVTPKAQRLLNSANREYFKRLHEDPKLRRKVSKRISDRQVIRQSQASALLERFHRMRCDLSWDHRAVESFVERLPESKRSSCYDSLNTLREKKFSPLYHNHRDNRVWSEATNVPGVLRHLLRWEGKPYLGEIDQRACHPGFLGHFLFDFLFPSSTHPSLSSIYDGVKPDTEAGRLVWEASVERCLYHTLFVSNPDPREEMAKAFGTDTHWMKRCLNRWLNGWKDTGLEEWFSAHFPVLHRGWSRIERRETGNEISRRYETRLWQDLRLYEWLEAHGMGGIYTYDGISLFGPAETKANAGELLALIRTITKAHFGFEVVAMLEWWDGDENALVEKAHQQDREERANEARRRGLRKKQAKEAEEETIKKALRRAWNKTHHPPPPPPTPPPPNPK